MKFKANIVKKKTNIHYQVKYSQRNDTKLLVFRRSEWLRKCSYIWSPPAVLSTRSVGTIGLATVWRFGVHVQAAAASRSRILPRLCLPDACTAPRTARTQPQTPSRQASQSAAERRAPPCCLAINSGHRRITRGSVPLALPATP